ncbi:MAG: hypothetical protein WDM94_09905 [Bauldia sp.]
MADTETTFSQLVFQRAARNIVLAFRDRRIDAVLTVFSLAVGSALFQQQYGWDAVKEQLATFIAYVLAPFGLVALILSLWHLALAPSELLYEGLSRDVARSPRIKTVNWTIWKQRAEFTVDEFASILAQSDPVAIAQPTEQVSYRALILEEMRKKALPYIVEKRVGLYDTRAYDAPPEGSTHIKREDAVAWAEAKKFPVDHFK